MSFAAAAAGNTFVQNAVPSTYSEDFSGFAENTALNETTFPEWTARYLPTSAYYQKVGGGKVSFGAGSAYQAYGYSAQGLLTDCSIEFDLITQTNYQPAAYFFDGVNISICYCNQYASYITPANGAAVLSAHGVGAVQHIKFEITTDGGTTTYKCYVNGNLTASASGTAFSGYPGFGAGGFGAGSVDNILVTL